MVWDVSMMFGVNMLFLGCEYDVSDEHTVVWDVSMMFGVNMLFSGM